FDTTDTASTNKLVSNGLKMAPQVNLRVIRANSAGYCLAATHDNLMDGANPTYEVYFSSSNGAPSTTACT
ncbi:MAG TPA: hypothetical protein VG318_02155, partial [Actinomycetota bacterium]|nr:hypothetical protein [Actinomycetota bacterium]